MGSFVKAGMSAFGAFYEDSVELAHPAFMVMANTNPYFGGG
jgi:hypothetical protein